MKTYEVGETIAGDYLVEAVLGGAGLTGMGAVYKVWSRELDEPLVIKTIQAELVSPEMLKRFKREATLWVDLGSHPNIVRALDVRELDWQLMVFSEYVEPDQKGRNTVGHFIHDGTGVHERALRWAQQFAFAMQHAAARGLRAHRDIKPDNLMVDATGNLKVCDFGLAGSAYSPVESNNSQLSGSTTDVGVTRAGSFFGTLPYMAPEQFAGAEFADFRSDLYAFGIVLYQLVSAGRYPYRMAASESPQVFFDAHCRAVAAKLETPLWPLIDRCLQKRPDDRYQSLDQFLDEVQRISRLMGYESVPRPEPDVETESDESFAKAKALVGLGRPREALSVIERHLQRWPENAGAWTEKGRIHLVLSENEESIAASNRSLTLDPGNSHALNNLGLALQRVGRTDEAIEALLTAIEEDPGNTGAMMNVARPLLAGGRHAQAAELLVRALRIAPSKDTLRLNAHNTAVEMLKQRQGRPALEVFEELLKLGGGEPNLWSNLAAANLLVGNRRAAIGCFERLITLEGSSDAALMELTRLNASEGQIAAALGYCEQWLRLDRSNVKAVVMKAQLLQGCGRSAEAKDLLSEAIQRRTTDDTLWFFKAHICAGAGEIDEAIVALEQCEGILLRLPPRARGERLQDVRIMLADLRGRTR